LPGACKHPQKDVHIVGWIQQWLSIRRPVSVPLPYKKRLDRASIKTFGDFKIPGGIAISAKITYNYTKGVQSVKDL
jgi:hypothetical protein